MIKKFKNLLFVFILMFLFIFIGSTNNIAACNDPGATNYDGTYVTSCVYGTQSRIDSKGGGLPNPIGTDSFTELLERIILVSWGIIYIIGEILGAPDLVNKIK